MASNGAIFERWGVDPAGPSAAPAGAAAAPTIERWGASTTSPVEDVAKALPTGVAKGAINLAGLPGDARDLLHQGLGWLSTELSKMAGIPEDEAKAVTAQALELVRKGNRAPTSKEVRTAVEGVTGPLYEPKTQAGDYAQTVGEFVPTALGPGGVVRTAARAIVPGLATEAAGKATRALTDSPQMEAAARGGTALVTGAGTALLTRPRSAEQTVRAALPASIDNASIARAWQLLDDAGQRGINLTWAEAIERVAPGTSLPAMARILESAPGSKDRMAQFYAGRPAQIENAAGPELHAISPGNPAPSTIGPAVGVAADDALGSVRKSINDAAKPFYDSSAGVIVPPDLMAKARALPGFKEASDIVRGDPQLNRYVAHLPDDSVGFLNEVKKILDNAARTETLPATVRPNMQRAAGYTSDAAAAREIGIDASRRATPNMPAYEIALGVEQQGRQRFLEPLLQGPLGKLAEKDITTQRAVEALFPRNPLPNSADEVGTAVRALAQRNPRAAADLVRAHVEMTFNEATQALQTGANQMGGAKFAATLAGNPQQRANLQAAMEALPYGAQRWQGFERFLEIAEATGTRQSIGSRTSFNTQELQDLARGRITSEGAKVAVAPSRALTALGNAWDRWQLGQNLDELATILTDPRSMRLLQAIAQRPTGSGEAAALAGRLYLMHWQALGHETPPKSEQPRN